MVAITEQPIWEDDIRQIEANDPVQGGENGIDNIPHQQLANRTRYLKERMDGLVMPADNSQEVADLQKKLEDEIKARENGDIAKSNYSISSINGNYSINSNDMGKIIRVDSANDVMVTVSNIAVEIGVSFTVRRVNGAVSLTAGDGVTLLPADSTNLRRAGSTATLIYVGNGTWDIYTELGA